MTKTQAPDFSVSDEIFEALQNAGPEPIYSGSFAVFGKPNGNAVIVLHVTGQDEDLKTEIPAAMLKLIMSAAEGKGPLGNIGKMLGL